MSLSTPHGSGRPREPATPLEREVEALLREGGPIPVDRFMRIALQHPVHGYYVARDPFGARGDFTTAPEISQMFGELLGAWTAQVWLSLGAPRPFRLIELGPGRGTLMRDALRAAARAPGFREAARAHLVETSPVLREAQARALAEAGVPAEWHERLEDAPDDAPFALLANEFLDALPVRQFVRTERGWRERLVGLGADGRLAFGLSPEPGPLPAGLPANAPAGAVFEHAPAALGVAAAAARRAARLGGAALFLDYGSLRSGFGDTLQAVRGHRFVSPLDRPGESDLTVHVDFAALAAAARAAGAVAHGPVTQGRFLAALGLDLRAAALARRHPDRAHEFEAARWRLGGDGRDDAPPPAGAPPSMGALFKVLGLAPPGLALPGFEPPFPERSE